MEGGGGVETHHIKTLKKVINTDKDKQKILKLGIRLYQDIANMNTGCRKRHRRGTKASFRFRASVTEEYCSCTTDSARAASSSHSNSEAEHHSHGLKIMC